MLRNAIFVAYLIEGHYKIPQDSLVTMQLNKVVLKKGELEPLRLMICYYCLTLGKSNSTKVRKELGPFPRPPS